MIRRAGVRDVAGMLAVKAALRVEGASARAGFLLGSSEEQYAAFVEHAVTLVMEADGARRDGELDGFAILLPDAVLRATELWAKRHAAAWAQGFDIDAVAAEPVAYIEQLAVRPGAERRWYAPALAWRLIEAAEATGHRHVFTTTVEAPFRNEASLAFLALVGARRVGSLVEAYPGVGAVESAVHCFPVEGFAALRGAAGRRPLMVRRLLRTLAAADRREG